MNSWSRQLANIRVSAKEPDLFAGYNLVADGITLPDVLGNNNGIVYTSFAAQYNTLGKGIRFEGDESYSSLGSSFGAINNVTVSFWMRPQNVTDTVWALNKHFSTTDAWGIRIASNTIHIRDDIDDASSSLYSTAIEVDKWYHIVAVLNASLENKLYINGQLVGSGIFSTGHWDSFGGFLFLAARFTSTSNAFAEFVSLKIFDVEKSADWVKQQYNEGKKSLWSTSYGANISSSAVTGGSIENTPFRVGSGSHKIASYSINGVAAKAIECVTAGDISIVSGHYHADNNDSAYGDFECWIEKASGHTTKLGFINQNRDNVANGYGVQILTDGTTTIEEWGVGSIVTGGSLTPSTLAKINLKRNTLGDAFEGFIDGISFGTGSDSTIVKSYYSVFSLGVGDKIVYADRNGGYAIVKRLVA